MTTANADLLTVTTHDNVAVGFTPAGLGSRFMALLIDTLVFLPVGIIIGYGTYWLLTPAATQGGGADTAISNYFTVTAASLTALMAFTLYFIIAEGLTSGRTIGKRVVGIRVVRIDGSAMGWSHALLRGLAKSPVIFEIDLLLGPLVMFFHPLARRIGDLIAGTLVVHESPPAQDQLGATPTLYLRNHQPGPPIGGLERLGPRELTVLRTMLAHPDLHPLQRQRVATRLSAKLIERLGTPADAAERQEHPESFVERVYLQLALREQ